MKIIEILGLFVILVLLSACTNVVNEKLNERLVSTNGNAEIKVNPDQAEIILTIVSKAATASKAQNKNAKETQNVYKALKKWVSEEDISTEGYYLREKRRWNPATKQYDFDGYELTHTLKIVVKDLDNVGEVLQRVVDSEGNEGNRIIQGISFTLSEDKEREMKEKALVLAVKNAKEKAEIMVKNLGAKLGEVKTISERSYDFIPFSGEALPSLSMKQAENIMPAPSPKDVSVRVSVSVEFTIK